MFRRCAWAITAFGAMACAALLLPIVRLPLPTTAAPVPTPMLLPPTTAHKSAVITLLYSGDTDGELESCG